MRLAAPCAVSSIVRDSALSDAVGAGISAGVADAAPVAVVVAAGATMVLVSGGAPSQAESARAATAAKRAAEPCFMIRPFVDPNATNDSQSERFSASWVI
jgi:hypothetical protein